MRKVFAIDLLICPDWGGRIYHMPGQQHYDQTLVDATKGERWFCSPRDAEQAGWRAARQ